MTVPGSRSEDTADVRTVTVMVTDLVGSTDLRVGLGEDAADDLQLTHDVLLRAAVEGHGGAVIKGLGDGVLAVFSSASDAVAAATAAQQAAYAHTRRQPELPLDLRVGLSAGDVIFRDDDCFGTPVVEASRLCAVALGGQILAADLVRVLGRGRGGTAFTAAGIRELKGLPDPVAVATVGWEPPDVSPAGSAFPPRLARQAPLPFSGRTPELDRLTELWKRAANGEKWLVTISGEAGIGKTRLVAELARWVYDGGGTVLFGHSDEEVGIPFQAFVEALEQHAPSVRSAADLGRYPGDLARLAPDLALQVPDLQPALEGDPETERYRLLEAVASWLAATSRSTPVLFILDDLHWADRPTLLLLRHLMRSTELARVLFVGTYRHTDVDRTDPLGEVLSDLRREYTVDRVQLTGLDVSGISELLTKAAGQMVDPRVDELAQALWSETEGHPFFLQEIILHLLETGRVVQRDGVWTTDLEIGDLGIPEGIRDVVGRRLSRLSDSANQLLSIGSVIGPTLDVDLLVEVSSLPGTQVLDALEEAMGAALLRELDADTFEFTHALVRSTLYEELSATRRVRIHRQIAEALEARQGDPGVLAYHFRLGSSPDRRVVDYAAAAGREALDGLAFDLAVTLFSQAVEAAEDLDLALVYRGRLLIELGTAQRYASMPEHRSTLLRAARLGLEAGDVELVADAALANSRGLWSVTGGLDEERVEVLEAALAGLGQEESTRRAALMATLANELFWRDPDLRRLKLADGAVDLARRLGDDRCLLRVQTTRQVAAWTPDRVSSLYAELPDIMDRASRVDDAQDHVYALAWSIVHSMEMRDLARASSAQARMAEVAEETNNLYFRWLAAVYGTMLRSLSGSGDDVEVAASTALQYGQEANQPDAFVWYAPQLMVARTLQGRVEEILDVLRVEASNPGLPIWLPVLAGALLEAGHVDEAKDVFEVLPAGDPLPWDGMWLLGHGYLAEVISALGSVEQATAEFRTLSPYAGMVPCIGTTVRHSLTLDLATLAARAGEGDTAEVLFARAYDEHLAMSGEYFLAETELAWARFRRSRNLTADDSLLAAARSRAERLGFAGIRARAIELSS